MEAMRTWPWRGLGRTDRVGQHAATARCARHGLQMSGEQEQQEGQECSQGHELSRRRAIGYGGAVATGVVAAGLLQTSTATADERGGSGRPAVGEPGPGQPDRGRRHRLRAQPHGHPADVRTSIAFRAATADLATRTTDPGRIASFTSAGFSLLGGGGPIVENGAVIGAVAVGGGTPEQDDEVARSALLNL